VTVKPFVGLDALTLRRSSYTETQEIGITYPAQSFTKVLTKVGPAANVRFDANGTTYLPEVRAAWGHDLRDTTLTTQAALLDNPFTVDAAKPGRDAALIDLSLTAWRSNQFRVFASLSGEYRRNAISQQIAGGFRYAW
jgi:outer membrane autotransporter protein